MSDIIDRGTQTGVDGGAASILSPATESFEAQHDYQRQ